MMTTTLAAVTPEVTIIKGLENSVATTMEECINALRANNLPTFPNPGA